MKQQLLLIIFLLIIGDNLFAQRNIIDVPTSSIVDWKHSYFQNQTTISKGEVKTFFIYTYGIGNKWEVGALLHQITFPTVSNSPLLLIDPSIPEDNPDFLLHGQKGFELNKWYRIGIGTRVGINAYKEHHDIKLVNFSFLNNQFHLPETDHKLIIGMYYGTNHYLGPGNNYGLLLGLKIELIKDKLSFLSDFISGINSSSIINTALQVSLPRHWQIALASAIPFPGSGNLFGGVIQIARYRK